MECGGHVDVCQGPRWPLATTLMLNWTSCCWIVSISPPAFALIFGCFVFCFLPEWTLRWSHRWQQWCCYNPICQLYFLFTVIKCCTFYKSGFRCHHFAVSHYLPGTRREGKIFGQVLIMWIDLIVKICYSIQREGPNIIDSNEQSPMLMN